MAPTERPETIELLIFLTPPGAWYISIASLPPLVNVCELALNCAFGLVQSATPSLDSFFVTIAFFLSIVLLHVSGCGSGRWRDHRASGG